MVGVARGEALFLRGKVLRLCGLNYSSGFNYELVGIGRKNQGTALKPFTALSVRKESADTR